jgi:hypothetical protein
MQCFDVHGRRSRLWAGLAVKYISSAFQKLATPLCDLIGMDMKLLG